MTDFYSECKTCKYNPCKMEFDDSDCVCSDYEPTDAEAYRLADLQIQDAIESTWRACFANMFAKRFRRKHKYTPYSFDTNFYLYQNSSQYILFDDKVTVNVFKNKIITVEKIPVKTERSRQIKIAEELQNDFKKVDKLIQKELEAK